MKKIAEQKPQDNVTSALRVEASELLVPCSRFASCEPKSCEFLASEPMSAVI